MPVYRSLCGRGIGCSGPLGRNLGPRRTLFLTRAEAVSDAKKRLAKKIKSLHAQAAKLIKMMEELK